ncbi:hypothetical protein M2407_004627 [Serratia sp. BIGb0234]|nr:hypothetical protein [Serratia sp. BIGb0234]
MVAQAGQPSGWPVSIEAGIPTPVWATTHKRRNFGGSNNHYSMEAATMATIPPCQGSCRLQLKNHQGVGDDIYEDLFTRA